MYQVEFTRVATKSLQKISSVYQEAILEKIEALAKEPYSYPNVKALRGMENTYRLRVSDYRVVYQINDGQLIILVIDIDHRGRIYKKR